MKLFRAQGGRQAKHHEGGLRSSRCCKRSVAAFTLTEVAISLMILVLVFQGIIKAYTTACQRSEWSAHSLAAQSLAQQNVEAMRAAQWDPATYPVLDEGGQTNFRSVDVLDIISTGATKTQVYATNVVSVTNISVNPPLRQIRADCIWIFKPRGLFTNTVITLRAPDQ